MSKLTDALWVEKYRPKSFDDLVCDKKTAIAEYLKNPESIPSFIFYSSGPGTGKTSTAKLIVRELGSDMIQINASDERGIDTIRDKVRIFAQSMSSVTGMKRCVFLDEADGLTKQAQESMKALMEMYSKNCFFILSCNDYAKIIEPIRNGRCVSVNYEKPPKDGILNRLKYVCKEEGLKFSDQQLQQLVDHSYPDIRSMILALQTAKIEGKEQLVDVIGYDKMMQVIKEKNVQALYDSVYSGKLDIRGFVRYYFEKLFQYSDKVPLDRLTRIAVLLADIEKSWAIGVTHELVFISNMLQIMNNDSK